MWKSSGKTWLTRDIDLQPPAKEGRAHRPGPAWQWRLPALIAALLMILMNGCQAPPPAAETPSPRGLPATDASAERLHDLSGSVLLYYLRHRRLPPTLEALAADLGTSAPPMVSPHDGQPYRYHMPPLALPRRTGTLLIHDLSPITLEADQGSSTFHWAVLIEQGEPGSPLTSQVILIPAAELRAALGHRDETR